jgi:pimeloyl-ACP methyl ester carboxylesterase
VPTVRTPTLEIGYEEWGEAAGTPVVLLHGFPDDAHAWDGVAPPLAAQGCRVLAPYLRGYGQARPSEANVRASPCGSVGEGKVTGS